MRTLNFILVLSAFMSFACHTGTKNHDMHEHSDSLAETKPSPSPHKTAMHMIGNNHVHMEYSAPSVRGREIWGALVPYDKIWVTGAHMATTIEFNSDLLIAGNKIPAGKYALFTIPGEKEWTVIINKNWDQHQADHYNTADDVVRVKTIPEQLTEPVEQLTFEVNSTSDKKGNIVLQWEKLKISIDIESPE